MTTQQRKTVMRLNLRVQRVTGKVSVPYIVNRDGTVDMIKGKA